jgi:predicted ATPase
MTLFDDAAGRYPVILSSHSDRLLDALVDPVASVVVCDLDANSQTHLRRLDAAQFERWRAGGRSPAKPHDPEPAR